MLLGLRKGPSRNKWFRHRLQICIFSGFVIGWWSKLRAAYPYPTQSWIPPGSYHNGTAWYEVYEAGQEEFRCVGYKIHDVNWWKGMTLYWAVALDNVYCSLQMMYFEKRRGIKKGGKSFPQLFLRWAICFMLLQVVRFQVARGINAHFTRWAIKRARKLYPMDCMRSHIKEMYWHACMQCSHEIALMSLPT